MLYSNMACSMHGKNDSYIQNVNWKTRGRDHLGDLGVDGRVILKLILKLYVLRMWTGFMCIRIVSSGVLS